MRNDECRNENISCEECFFDIGTSTFIIPASGILMAMQYSKVYVEAIGYELAPVVVTSTELEQRLEPLYTKLRIAPGQLEAWTGIAERRWWDAGHRLSDGATEAARRALENSHVAARDLDVLIYAGVCREHFEPATACSVALASSPLSCWARTSAVIRSPGLLA